MTQTQESGQEPSEMVMRVAKALCKAQGLVWEHQSDPMRSGSGDDDTSYYLKQARAAIAAMREPTNGMSEAAHRMDLHADADPLWADGWRVMIDAALSSPTGVDQTEGER